MARDKPPLADGTGPGGLRPTVITAPPARAATAAPPARVATAAPRPAQAKPTVFAGTGTSGKRKATPRALPPEGMAAPERKSFGATAIPGIAPERIAVTLADLRNLSPGIRPEVAESALRLVQGFVPTGLSDRRAVMWGHQVQLDYTDLVSRTLNLSQSDTLRNVSAHVGRMIDILGSIDIEAACGITASSTPFGGFFKGMNSRIDTPAELQNARIELEQLVSLLNSAFGDLLAFKDKVEQQSRLIDTAGDAAEASALAALFLADHLAQSSPALAERFAERSMSLTQTVAQVRSGTDMRAAQIEQPLTLIATIQNVALVMVPGWLGSIAALSTLQDARRQPTPTEARELAHQLRAILQQFKS